MVCFMSVELCSNIFPFPHILKSSVQCFWRVLHWNLLFTSWGWVCVIFLNNAETQAACSTASFLISFSMSCLLHPSWVQLYIYQWKGGLFQTSHKQLSIIHTEENIVSNPHRSKLEYQYQSQCECLWVCIMCICVVCPFRHTLSVLLITMWTLCCLSPT